MNWLVDGLGILGILTTIMVYQQKTQKRLLIWKMITDVIWILHYWVLGAYSAIAITVVAILRSIVLLNVHQKWAQSKAWLYIFLGASLALSLIAWQNAYSALMLLSSFLCIIAYWLKKPMLTRLLSIPAASSSLIYNYVFHSREGVLSNIFSISSAIVGFFRHDIQQFAPHKRKVKEKTV